MSITATDLFCGAGGSSTGLIAAGVDVVMASNHWTLAVETHNTNHPDVDHDCADISQVDPRRYPKTDILWASPSCTNHSIAKASNRMQVERGPGRGELYPPLPVEAAERSRATMWDVVRFAEFHQYKTVIVENVVDVVKWVLFDPWVMAMRNLGYRHQIVYLNSMFAGDTAAPQSRDRAYVVFWRDKGGRVAPDLAIMPRAHCNTCGGDVDAFQSWKKPNNRWGRYRQQYNYRCWKCSELVEPYALPASSAIDWTLPGHRIGDRAEPLAAGTMRRIQTGLDKFAGQHWTPLIVPLERNNDDGKQAKAVWEPFATQTARATNGIAMPFITELRGGGSDSRSVVDPLCTVTASGNHHMLVQPQMLVPYYRTGVAHPVSEPIKTITTTDRNALVGGSTDIDDCSFRMLTPAEIQRGMAFPDEYIVLGNKRERVKQLGNAVTPPASKVIAERIIKHLGGNK